MRYTVDPDGLRLSTYRPFFKQHVHMQRELNDMIYRLPQAFPVADSQNLGFYLNGVHASADFAGLMTNALPCLDVFGKGGQFFPRYTYVESGADLFSQGDRPSSSPDRYTRVDNITDATLASYRAKYGATVTKDDVFFYVYGLLHSPHYRERFAADLKKMLPRIPHVPSAEDFRAFSDAGRALSELHVGYETVQPYELQETWGAAADGLDEYERYRITKMKYGGSSRAGLDKTIVKYNGWLTLTGIPEETQRYMLGSRSALDWILDRYEVKPDKASGIVNDPNDWSREHEQPRYIRDLIGRIVTVSLETMRIVDALPGLEVE